MLTVSISWYILIAAWIPFLCYIINKRMLYRYPFITVYAATTFIFLIAGSFYALNSTTFYQENYFSINYYLLLVFSPAPIVLAYVVTVMCFSTNSFSSKNTLFKKYKKPRKTLFVTLFPPIVLVLLGTVVHVMDVGIPIGWQLGNIIGTDTSVLEAREIATSGEWHSFVYRAINYGGALLGVSLMVRSFELTNPYAKLTLRLLSIFSIILFGFFFMYKAVVIEMLFVVVLGASLYVGKIKARYIVALALFFSITVYSSYLVYGHTGIQNIILQALHRTIGVYSTAAAIVPKIVVENGLFYGTTAPNPMGLFPFHPVSLPNVIHQYYYGQDGNMTAPSLAVGFANFGWFGVVLMILLTSLVLTLSEIFKTLFIRNSDRVIISAWLSWIIGRSAFSDPFSSWLNPYTIIIIGLVLLLYLLGLNSKWRV